MDSNRFFTEFCQDRIPIRSVVSMLPQFVLLLILGGCATIGSGRPDWVLQPPQDSMNLYFVGIASGTKTLQEGQESALKDALGKIANYLGTRVKSSSQQIVNEIGQRLEVQISADSDAQIKEADLLEWSVKEYDSLFDVYALVKISKGFKDLNKSSPIIPIKNSISSC